MGYGVGIDDQEQEEYFAEFKTDILMNLPWAELQTKFQEQFLSTCFANSPQQWATVGRLSSGILTKTRNGQRSFLNIIETLCLDEEGLLSTLEDIIKVSLDTAQNDELLKRISAL